MSSVRHNVAYIAKYQFEDWVDLDAAGKVTDAGPIFRSYIGRNIHDIRGTKAVVKIEVAPTPEKPRIIA